jgi:outer membrane protein TolC
MKIRQSLFGVLLSVVSLSATAQELTLDLFGSIGIATDSSLQAFREKNLYYASYWEFRQFKARRLPSLWLSMTPVEYYRDFTKRYDYDNNIDVYRSQQSLYSYGRLSLQQNFDLTGGTFYVDSDLGYMRNFGESNYSQFSAVPFRVRYSQTLFGFNSFKWEKRIEPLKFERARRALLTGQEKISETTISLFFDLAMKQMLYDMAVENLRSADTLYRIGQERYRIAGVSQETFLTLELDVVNRSNGVKNAELDLKRAQSAFVSYLNLSQDRQVRLVLPDKPADIVISADEALDLARQNNPDFLSYRQDELEAEREVERTGKSSLFDASLSASIGFNQVAETFANVYRQPRQQDVVNITLSVPLVDWGERRGKLKMAQNTLNEKRLSIEQTRVALEQDIIMTVNDFNIQRSLIASVEKAVELARLAYTTARERFIIGKVEISTLNLALNNLNSARSDYISALNKYWQSYYKIRRLTLYDFHTRESLADKYNRIYNLTD